MSTPSPARLETEILYNFADWEAERIEFDRLAGDYFTRRFAWLSAAWQHRGSAEASLFICKASDNGQVVGYLPLYLSQSRVHGRTLSLIGDRRHCSDDAGLYVTTGREQHVATAIVQTLGTLGRSGQWDYLDLDGVRIDRPGMRQLLGELRREFSGSFWETTGEPCRVLSLPPTWDGYLASLGNSSRKNYRRLERKMLDSGRLQYEVAATRDRAKYHCDQIAIMHQRRRHSLGHSGCLDETYFEAFIEKARENLWEDGSWFSILGTIEGQVVCGTWGAINNKMISAYMLGMEPAAAEHQAGLALNLAMIRYAQERGVPHIDFMRGNEVYKSRLGAAAVPQYRWRAAAPRLLPRIRGGAIHATKAVNNWFRAQAASTQPQES